MTVSASRPPAVGRLRLYHPAAGISLDDAAALRRVSQIRTRSEADYRTFQAFQAKLLLKYLAALGIDLAGCRVLDLGSGVGGYSEEMARRGAHVFSLDLVASLVKLDARCLPVVASALQTPLASGSMDFVFCASLIEHLPAPELLMAEIERVLAPGGYCYLSFPPFYSPLGGHEYAPWHYFGYKVARRLSGPRRRRSHPDWVRRLYGVKAEPKSFEDSYADWGLYRMTVAKAQRILAASGLRRIDMSTRYLPASLIGCPALGELTTWHAQFLLHKPAEQTA